ncbi:FlgK family flagellar hook-associated protein, partial [Aquabacterium sp. A08]|uniref:FlgK family flagellar hook-associated protein n=1 Tax=Aquabacterium sp. A08 TaxID=2718532 RepID=UPI00387E89EC|nr:hypothetical protein [Aquabacterium sp. A08]
ADVRNQLGRLALSMVELTNRQHQAGLDLNGDKGQPFFGPISLDTRFNITPSTPAILKMEVDPSDPEAPTRFQASDYAVRYTDTNKIEIRRVSDGKFFNPDPDPAKYGFTSTTPIEVDLTSGPVDFDGLRLTQTTSGNPGDQILLSPFATVASQVKVALTAPAQLAIASPVLVQADPDNGDGLQVEALYRPYNTVTAPAWANTVVTFGANGQYSLETSDGTTTTTSGP